MPRYILNGDNRTVHDSQNLSEKCNTDQIKHRRLTEYLPTFYHQCEHCMPSRVNTLLNTETSAIEEEEQQETSQGM